MEKQLSTPPVCPVCRRRLLFGSVIAGGMFRVLEPFNRPVVLFVSFRVCLDGTCGSVVAQRVFS